jgi:hypothetical protein
MTVLLVSVIVVGTDFDVIGAVPKVDITASLVMLVAVAVVGVVQLNNRSYASKAKLAVSTGIS